MTMRRTLSRSTLLWLAGVGAITIPTQAAALDPFEDATADLNNEAVYSGNTIAVYDMNGDGLDDLARLNDTEHLEIEYQNGDGTWAYLDWGDIPGTGAWGMAVADVDGNGYADLYVGGFYDGKKIVVANEDGSDFTITTLGGPDVFTQCSSFADIDNNGTLDLFVCHDDGLSVPLSGDGAGGFTWDASLINAVSTEPSDNSGNYGNTWTDYDLDGDLDLYIAKCRLGVGNENDGRRTNLLFENDGEGGWNEVALERGLRPGGQSWAADFADIDNDNDFDAFIIHHDMTSQLMENDGDNNFSDITVAAGISGDLSGRDFIQTHFEDFDNDTFVDLLVTGRSGAHFLFINNGDNTFTPEDAPFPTGGPAVHTAAVGDLNNDGFPDIAATFATGYASPSNNEDKIFLNPGNENNWFNVRLTGVESSPSATGAMVELHGPWGIQRREVRNGEAYGITNSATRHFGLGTAESIDQVVILWPSGTVDTIDDPPINVTVHVSEGCATTFYADTDGDGYGDPDAGVQGCIPPEGHVENDGDCDDGNEAINPDADEVCDGEDNNCDGDADEGLEDCDPGGSSTGDDPTGDPTDATVTASTTGLPPTTSPTTDSSSESETDGDDTSGADDDEGCSCNAQRPASGAWMLLLLFGAAMRRRRIR